MAAAAPDRRIEAALQELYRRQAHGIKLGLEFTQSLLDDLGHPERAFAAIHVAGTNGKGSVCAMLEAVLRQAGVRTGLYTSPHLVRFNERVRVNGAAIPDATIAALMKNLDAADQRMAARTGGRPATFFEYTTALAFEHFRRERVEIAVLETGMGGRLDATNVVDPLLSVITSIGLDHTQYLGRTIEKIAEEKAGIIKTGRPVICGVAHPEAREVILNVARERRARAVLPAESVAVRRLKQDLRGQRVKIETAGGEYGPLTLPLIGSHQLENCAMAVAALEEMGSLPGWTLDERAIVRGLESVAWPARGQLLSEDPPVLLDAAHNPAGATVLSRTLKEVWPDRPVAVVAGLSADKDADGFFRALAPRITRGWATQARVERAMPSERVAEAAKQAGLRLECGDLVPCYENALTWARDNKALVVVAGSIYLAGELLDALGMAPG